MFYDSVPLQRGVWKEVEYEYDGRKFVLRTNGQTDGMVAAGKSNSLYVLVIFSCMCDEQLDWTALVLLLNSGIGFHDLDHFIREHVIREN